MKKVLVFGTFDGIHDGHRNFFKQAAACGDHLVAVVAQDHTVEELKGRLPRKSLAERIDDLMKEKLVDEVELGDAELGAYEVAKKHRPAVIAMGYDQEELLKDLKSHLKEFDWKPKLVVLESHKADTHHSSILNRK